MISQIVVTSASEAKTSMIAFAINDFLKVFFLILNKLISGGIEVN